MFNDAIALVFGFSDEEKKMVCVTYLDKDNDWIWSINYITSLDDAFKIAEEHKLPIYLESIINKKFNKN